VNCDQTRCFLDAYVDGELDLVRHLEVEHHLLECTSCTEAHEARQALRSALHGEGLYFRAPPGLRERLLAAAPAPTPPVPQTRRPWLRSAVLAASVAVVFWGLGRMSAIVPRPADEELQARAVLSSHLRSLQMDHLTDVASSDQHTVKPWFTGKVDFAPTVRDFAGAGFPLVGGRLDTVEEHTAAALVYRRRQHVINVFLWPASDAPSEPRTLERQGYRLVHWTGAGIAFWVVSDVSAADLGEFVRLLRTPVPDR
jgi:anti-sigma factor RsiW